MSTIIASTLIDRASIILQDATNVRWPRPELLGWLNDGEREIVLHKPNAYIKHVPVALVLGSKQTLPVDAVSLIDIPRNVNGPAVRVVSREILDAQSPGWHTMAVAAVIKHYMYSPLDPRTFYVYPPATTTPAAVNVDLVYAASPADITETVPILIDDVYATALINYILYRAYSKDAEYAANAAQATAYYGQFMTLLGAKVTAETVTSPMQALGGFNPNIPATQK
jgi:hypothetical protein